MNRLQQIDQVFNAAFADDAILASDLLALKEGSRLDNALGNAFSPLIEQWQDGMITASELVRRMTAIAFAEASNA